MVTLLARWQLAYNQREIQIKVRDEAAAQVTRLDKEIDGCKAACAGLGFDRNDKKFWPRVVDAFAYEAAQLYNRTKTADLPVWDREPPTIGPPPPPPPPLPSISLPKQAPKQIEATALLPLPPIKDVILDRLTSAGGAGAKATEIRNFIASTYAGEIHEKTVGMTLYRLLRDGRVRREGHTWFIVPPKAEAMNPGAGTPGSEE